LGLTYFYWVWTGILLPFLIHMNFNKVSISASYCEVFDSPVEPLIVRSPGRVNIIGEHTDYNEGFVLPAAIDKAMYVAIGRREDDKIVIYATQYAELFETSLAEITRIDQHWSVYVLGIVDQLKKGGSALGGFNLLIDGDIPIGAGLSSSAALECATVFALNSLFKRGLSRAEMAHIAMHAEHEFAGVKCGVMDMFTSLFGRHDHVINLDCRSLLYEYIPFNMDGLKILLLNTHIKHSHSSSEYNTRRQQCEQGVAWVKAHVPEVNALRDVTHEMLCSYVLPKDNTIYRRCKYVVEENNRLLTACVDLKKGNIAELGRKMYASHRGLSIDYEVSSPELDYLIDQVKGNRGVLGARMMGGGFGGCTLNIVKEEILEDLVDKVTSAYQKDMGQPLSYYIASIENGTELLSNTKLTEV
jgi:galactokinase